MHDGDPDIRITFGMIVLNGEPFVRYNLRALYPFAHQIIVVEGASPAAKDSATADGHSLDSTLLTLRQFQAEEDHDGKVTLVTAEDEGHPDGFWEEKDEMSQAYAKRATGDWLWQVDADEFYLPSDMEQVISLLVNQPLITQVSFRFRTFSGSTDCLVDGFYLRCVMKEVPRLFAWRPSYRYAKHRPPTVIDDQCRNLAVLSAISARMMAKKGIFMYHYEQLFPKQVEAKCSYYAQAEWTNEMERANAWLQDCYLHILHPYHVHMVYRYFSWLERYRGMIPPSVKEMMEAVKQGQHQGIDLRQVNDIDELLRSPLYIIGRGLLKACVPFYCAYSMSRKIVGNWRRHYLKIGRKSLSLH